MNFLTFGQGNGLTFGRDVSGATTLGIRPEHITVADGSGVKFADVRVDLVENLGGQTVVYATTTDGQSLTIVLEGQRTVELGSTLPAYVDPAQAHLFDAQGMAIR
jgi:multiple sugar transport system ATP-binding protein